MIAFAYDGSHWRLVRIDPDQGSFIEFISMPHPDVDYQNPQVSPDGEYILVAAKFDDDFDIYVLNYQSKAIFKQITHSSSSETSPDWFPDGNRFVFIDDYIDRNVRMESLEERDNVWLTTGTSHEYSPHVSPNGEHIVYYSSRENNVDIYVYAMADGTEERITTDAARDAEGTFSRDEEWIVFESNRNGNYDLWAVRTDGSDLQQITSDSADEQVPYFSRDGEWLFYQYSEDGGNYDIYRMPWDK